MPNFLSDQISKKSLGLAEQQIKEAKNYLRTTSKRESASLAAKQIDLFLEKIIPIGNKIHDKKVEVNYPKFEGKINNFTKDELFELEKEFLTIFCQKMKDLEFLDFQLINLLEAFATYFTKGIADEEIAFSSVGYTYCDYVETYYPQISFLREYYNPNNPYNNLIELYKIWNERLEKYKIGSELEKKQSKLKQEIEDIDILSDKFNKESSKIKPLGTE